MRGRRCDGFSLLELLVAIAIFAVLSVLTYGGLRHVIRLDDGLRDTAARHQGLELALVILEQDIRHAVPRGVRDALGDSEPALRAGLGGELLTLTRVDPDIAFATAGPALSRVRYRLEDGALYRDVWARLDRAPTTPFRSRRLLDGITGFDIEFFDDAQWRAVWPRTDAGPAADALPRGVAIAVEFGSGRSVRRVVVRS